MPLEPGVSKNIRTMKKDIDLAQGRVSVGVEENEESLLAAQSEQEARLKEEERLRGLEEQGRKMAAEAVAKARAEKEATIAKAKAEEEERKERENQEAKRRVEMERLMALQEERKRAEEEERKRISQQQEAEKMAAEAVVAKARAEKEATIAKAKAEEDARAKAAAALAAKKTEKDILLEEREKILKERSAFDLEISGVKRERSLLEEKKKIAMEKIESVELKFKEIEDQEKKIEGQVLLVEEKQVSAGSEPERKSLERKRQQLEDRRHAMEKNRWPWDERLQEAGNSLLGIEKQLRELENRERALDSKEKEISSREDKNQLKLDKIRIKEEIKSLETLKGSLEQKSNSLFENFNNAKSKTDEVLREEEEIKAKKKSAEIEEHSAADLGQRRRLEQERWSVEETIREIETRKWAAEKEKERAANELKLCQDKLKSFSLRKEELSRKLDEIEQKLEGRVPPSPIMVSAKQTPPPPLAAPLDQASQKSSPPPQLKEEIPIPVKKIEPIPAPKPEIKDESPLQPEAVTISSLEAAKRRIEAMKKAAAQTVQEIPAGAEIPRETAEEKKKRMEEERKDIERLVLEDRRREDISRRENAVEKSYLPNKKSEKEESLGEMIRIIPKRPSWKEKFWIRLVILGFLLIILMGVLTFWYWYFRIRTQVPIPAQGREEQNQQVSIPQSIFKMEGPSELVLSGNLYDTLKDYFKQSPLSGKFTYLALEKNGKVLNSEEFAAELQTKMPAGLMEKLGSGFTVFSYGQGKGRIGLIVKTSSDGLSQILSKEESDLEKAFGQLVGVSGEEAKDKDSVFKDISKSGVVYRCKVFNASADFGICYYPGDYYFVLSSSSESMGKATSQMESLLKSEVLTKDLKIGDQGESVKLLQQWLARDIAIYPENLINSQFGDVTKKAVIRFQEKYKSEILIPRSLVKGTGIVDLLTRQKLNSLYSDF